MSITLLGAAMGTYTTDGYAQLRLRVQTSTQLGIHGEVRHEATTVAGRLLDSLGEGIPAASVMLTVSPTATESGASGSRHEVTTDPAGHFAVRLPGRNDPAHVEAAFAGTGLHLPARATQVLMPNRAPVTLRFRRAPAVLDSSIERYQLEVEAQTATDAAGIAIELLADGQPMASGATDRSGLARLEVSTSALPASTGTLVAHAPGDQGRAPASVAHAYVRRDQPRLGLEVDHRADLRRLDLTGRLTLPSGGLQDQAVGIFRDGRHLKTVTTGKRGRFALTLSDAAFFEEATSAVEVQARFASTTPTLASSSSTRLRVPLPPAPPSRLWLVPILLLPLLWAWFRKRVAGKRPKETLDPRGTTASVTGYQRGATRRLTRDMTRLAGSVVEAGSDAPLPGLEVTVTARRNETPDIRLSTDALGCFEVGPLRPGTYLVTVQGPGYEQVALEADTPHRGEWVGLRVRLRGLRDVAWGGYLPLARAALGTAEVVPTARETTGWLSHRLADAGGAWTLRDRVERAVYGVAPPVSDDVNDIADHTAKTLDMLGQAPPKQGR